MRIIVTISVFAFVIFVYWAGGGNFDRNPMLATALLFAFALGGCVWADPVWRDNK
jgi:hypothetical protein